MTCDATILFAQLDHPEQPTDIFLETLEAGLLQSGNSPASGRCNRQETDNAPWHIQRRVSVKVSENQVISKLTVIQYMDNVWSMFLIHDSYTHTNTQHSNVTVRRTYVQWRSFLHRVEHYVSYITAYKPSVWGNLNVRQGKHIYHFTEHLEDQESWSRWNQESNPRSPERCMDNTGEHRYLLRHWVK